jgi:predicted GTPase
VLRERTLALFPVLIDIARCRDAGTIGSRLEASAARLGADALTVVVCGEFKRGKSSLLNALLEESPPLFPVDARVATSVVTVVSWAPIERIVLSLVGVDGVAEERDIDRTEIADYVTESGRAGDGMRVNAVRVQTPHHLLESGLAVVDTPGVGGVFSAHTAATMAFLPSADAVVFVCDFTQPLLKSELDFLRVVASADRMVGDEDSLVFVMTKSDVVGAAQREELLHNTRVKIAEVTGREVGSLTIVPVSSTAKSDYLFDGDPQDLIESNFAAFETVLWSTVTRRRARVYLVSALTELESAVRALLRPLDDEQAALEQGTDQKLTELGNEAQARRAALDRLHRDGAHWREHLGHAMAEAGRGLQRDADGLLADVWHRADTIYLANAAHVADPNALVEKLTSDLSLTAGTLGELAQRRAARVLQDFAVRNGLELAHPRIDALPPPAVPPITLPPGTADTDSTARSLRKGRGFAEGSTAGQDLGGWVGGVIDVVVGLPGIGTFLGRVIGGLLGGAASATVVSEQFAEEDRAARREAIRIELAHMRTGHRRELERSLDDLVAGLVQAVTVELNGRIERERETVNESLRRLAATRDRTEQESRRRCVQIEAEREPLLGAQQEIDRIAGEAAHLGGSS